MEIIDIENVEFKSKILGVLKGINPYDDETPNESGVFSRKKMEIVI